MTEYGNAIEIMHTDEEWEIDLKEPFVWAPPLPQDKVEMAKRTLVYNFKRTRENYPALAGITAIEFVHGPCRWYIETIYEEDDAGNIIYSSISDEPIVLDKVVHPHTWIYSFAWYVNTDLVTRDKANREVIEVD